MWVIIPINDISRSFSRLSSILDLEQRIKLAKNLSSRLIHKMTDLNEVEKVVAFTSEKIWSNELNHPKLIVRSDEDTKPLKEKIDSIAD